MSEQKKPKSLQDINSEYITVASRIGDAIYKIRQHEKMLESLYTQADALNAEAAKLHAEQKQD